jgi:hypothetical protein
MTTALDRLTAGYYNSDLKSAGNPGGLAGEGALRVNFPLLLADIASVCADAATASADADAAATTAVNAPGTQATSSTNFTIPAVGADLAIVLDQANKAFGKGQTVVVSEDAVPLNQVVGVITAFVPATGHMTVHVLLVNGAATAALWNIGLSSPIDGSLTGRVTALESELDRQAGRRRLLDGELL